MLKIVKKPIKQIPIIVLEPEVFDNYNRIITEYLLESKTLIEQHCPEQLCIICRRLVTKAYEISSLYKQLNKNAKKFAEEFQSAKEKKNA